MTHGSLAPFHWPCQGLDKVLAVLQGSFSRSNLFESHIEPYFSGLRFSLETCHLVELRACAFASEQKSIPFLATQLTQLKLQIYAVGLRISQCSFKTLDLFLVSLMGEEANWTGQYL